ncbi:MAG: phenylalanine--tRNA ligase subunit beta [Acidimicrobiia bacterium]|nr:phenylalanine--tRNA ligase subunit beta [Acidimicrobiia bacterium]
MKVLLSWLQEFAPDIGGDVDDLGDTLSALGLAVEDTEVMGEGLEGIVLAEVLDLRPHPNADRIQLVDVDAGDGQALQVCCGAFNMTVGDLIPFAPIGTVMPNGMEIARRKMRDEWSNGMCCSAQELGLGHDHDGIMILTDEAAGTDLGTPIVDVLGLQHDVLWDLEVNANRPDALSVAGVARDLAAGLGVPFAFPEPPEPSRCEGAGLVRVELLDPTLGGRFLAQALQGVTPGASPAWMASRLRALGQRPINRIVDISNYVMLELGQPNHTYDLAKVPEGHLRVRRAVEGETLITLDGVERTLTRTDGVIADIHDRAIGIAGVMGGASTEISDDTTDVLLEMAWWDPPSISRSVRRLQLRSEASARYQRGADWGLNMERAMARFVQLIADTGAQAVGPLVDERGDTPDRSPIRVRPARINGLLGTGLDGEEMAGHLRSIGFEATPVDDQLDVTIPTWRWDTNTETDVAEEVARMYGYANIVRTVPRGEVAGGLTTYQQARRQVRDVLVGAGCDETFPMPFLAPGDLARCGLPDDGIGLSNPLVAEESVLRTSLLPGQLKAIAYNQSHRSGPVRLFEIGHVYLPSGPDQELPDEREQLAVALSDGGAHDAVAVLEVLADALALPNLRLTATEAPAMHPTRTAQVMVAGQTRGVVGEVDPRVSELFGVSGRVGWFELDLGATLDGPRGNRRYRPVSKHPSSDIDLAFVVSDEVPAAEVAGQIRKAAGSLLVDLVLFDVFRGATIEAGHRSLAYRLRFQAADRTLTDDEVGERRAAVIEGVRDALDAALR